MAMNISLGSGATLATDLVNGEHLQRIAPVTLAPRTDYIGLMSISGNVNIPSGVTVNNFPATQTINGSVNVGNLISLASGQFIGLNPTNNFIGLVSVQGNVNVSNFPAAGLVSLASGTEVRSLATILNFPTVQNTMATLYPRTDYIGLVSISGNVNVANTPTVNINGLTSLASGQEIRALATIMNFPATQNVAVTSPLPAGTNYIGLVSISGSIAVNSGQVTLFPGPNQIGSVTVSNIVAVSESGTWNVGLNAGSNFIGLATTVLDRSDILSTTNNSALFASSASGTMMNVTIRSITGQTPGVLNTNADANSQIALAVESFGLVNNGTNWDRTRTASAANNTTGTGLLGAGILGFDGTNYQRAFTDANGVMKSMVTVSNNITLASGSNFVGLATVVLDRSDILSTTNNSALFVSSASGSVIKTMVASNTGSTVGTTTAGDADGGQLGLVVNGHTQFFNGASWTRAWGANNANATTGLGLLGVGVFGFDGTNYQRPLTNLVSNATVATGYLNMMPLAQYGGGGRGSLASGSFHPLQSDSSGNLLISPATVTLGSPLPAGTNYIGLVSISGTVTATAGAVTLYPGPNQIGSVTISNNPTLGTGANFIGLATVVIGGGGAGNGAILDGVDPNLKASVYSTASGYPLSVQMKGITGNTIDVDSHGAMWVGLNQYAVGLGYAAALPFWVSVTGNVTISDSKNFIGLVSAASINGTVSITGSNGLVSNASSVAGYIDTMVLGQYGGGGRGSLASGAFHPMQVDSSGNLILGTGSSFIGLVTVGNIPAVSQSGTWNVGLNAGSNFIGLVSAASINGTVTNAAGTNFIGLISAASINGTVTNAAGTNFIGLVSAASINGTVTNAAGTAFIGLVSTASINGTVTLAAGTQVIGTATVYSAPIATYTSIASLISGSGAATLFTVPSGQRWILKDLLIGSMGQTTVQIQSEGRMMIPHIALATMGGFISNFGEAGLAAASINGSFVVNNGSAVTISVTANVRFQAF